MISFRAVLAEACLAAIIVALSTACGPAQPGRNQWASCSTSPQGTHQFGAFLLTNGEWNSSLPRLSAETLAPTGKSPSTPPPEATAC